MDTSNSPKGLLQRHWRTVVVFAGMLLDIVIHILSVVVAGALYLQDTRLELILATFGGVAVLSVTTFAIAFTMFGVYRRLSYSSFRDQILLAVRGVLVGTPLFVSARFFLMGGQMLRPEFLAYFLLCFALTYVLVWSAAHLWSDVLKEWGFGRANTIAIGSDPDFDRLLKRVEQHPELGYNVVSVVYTQGIVPPDKFDHVDVTNVRKLVQTRDIDQIIFSSSYQLNGSFKDLEEICRRNHISMRIVSPESDLLFNKAGLHDIAGVPVYLPARVRMQMLKAFAKRTFDLLGSLLILAIVSPVFLLVAIAIKLESSGPVLFRQKRSLGAAGTTFNFIKFRSMRIDAHKERDYLFDSNETDGALFKIRNDPRVTRVGRFIRKYSIDEFPQLLNVLKGEMSLVGPRPLPVKDYEHVVQEDHLEGYIDQRAQVKPGMTGLWQVSGRSDLGFREMVLLDLYYIENQSLLYDVEILAQTIPVVLFGKGAY